MRKQKILCRIGNSKEFKMKKLVIISLSAVFFLAGCGSDEYADLRKMTVQDYLANKDKMREVLDKCGNREIKDEDICLTAQKAISQVLPNW